MSRSYKRNFDHLRVPVAPPSKRHKSQKDYSRIRNYRDVDSYSDEDDSEGEDVDVEGVGR